MGRSCFVPRTMTAAANLAFCSLPWRIRRATCRGTRRFRESRRDQSPRLGKFSLPVPAPQPVNFVAADLYVHIFQLQKIGDGTDFILRRKDDGGLPDGRLETKFFRFAETFAEPESAVAHDAGKGNGLIERNLG